MGYEGPHGAAPERRCVFKHYQYSAIYADPSPELVALAVRVRSRLNVALKLGLDVGPNVEARIAHLSQIVAAGGKEHA